jgi:O-antigen ligase
MEMCTIFAVANFIARMSGSSFYHLGKIKDKILWYSTREANKALIYLFASIVMATSLFISTSRGGIMSFIAALAVLYFTCVISAGKRKRKRILLATLSVIILAVIMILWIGPEDTVDRFQMLGDMVRFFIKEKSILSELRPHMWKDTFSLIKDYPLFGVGLSNYAYVFPKYRTFFYHARLLRYAHNDYLHFVSEMGVLGLIFIIGFFLWYFKRFKECFRCLREINR